MTTFLDDQVEDLRFAFIASSLGTYASELRFCKILQRHLRTADAATGVDSSTFRDHLQVTRFRGEVPPGATMGLVLLAAIDVGLGRQLTAANP